jgi:predicted MFS family arabinose efflux permease
MPSADASPALRVLTQIGLIGFATALSARAVDPIVPLIAHSLAVAPATVALLSTAYALPFALIQPILGPVADMIGKVRLMIVCLLVIIATCFVSAAATSYPVLLVTRIICGMATGGIFPVGMAIIADAVAVEERQIAIARWLAIVIGGNLIGGALAGVIGDLLGWRAVFAVSGGCGMAAFAGAMINLRQAAFAHPTAIDVRSIPRGYLAIFANPRAKVCFLAVFLEGMAVFGLFPFVALLLAMAGETRASIAGVVLAGFSIGGVAYSLAVSELTRRWRAQQLMIGGGLTALAAFALIAMDFAWPAQFAAFIVLGIGFYSLHGCIQVESSELSQTSRGAAMSLHSFFFFVGQASGAVIYGIGFARLGPTSSVWLGGVAMALTGSMCARYLRRRPAA